MSYLNTILAKIIVPLKQQIAELVSPEMEHYTKKLDDLMILQGRALALKNIELFPLPSLKNAEFKVFSQFGEDGILQYLIYATGITASESAFVEFGVQNYSESNTRFLLLNNNWRGMILDGSKENIQYVRNQDIYWRYDLTAVQAWINRDNINQLLADADFVGQIGILSIDIDGNDYWVWEKIQVIDPIIVVVEWNSVFGRDHAIAIPYDSEFQREKAHYSNLYWGASIKAFEDLARRKGYSLVGSNTAGNNLFFVRNDRVNRLIPLSAKDAYVESRFRDARDDKGCLNFMGGARRRLEIIDLPVIDVVTGKMTTLRRLDEASVEA